MKMYNLGAAIAALMIPAALFAAATAPDRPGRHGGRGALMFQMADTNGDGVVTKAEFTAALEARFAKMDVNKDGKITLEDRQALRQQKIANRFGRIDTDSNGQISKSEFTAAETMGHGGKSDGAPDRAKDGPPPMGPMGRHRTGGRGLGADAGKDGTLTKAEFFARPMVMFDRIDANHDGKLTADELRSARPGRGMGMRGIGDDMPPPPPASSPPATQ